MRPKGGSLVDLLNRFFSRETSKNIAKERLRLVLVHDRANVSPQIMESIRGEIINVISRYMEIDESHMEVDLTNEDNMVALTANIPVRKVKRAAQEA